MVLFCENFPVSYPAFRKIVIILLFNAHTYIRIGRYYKNAAFKTYILYLEDCSMLKNNVEHFSVFYSSRTRKHIPSCHPQCRVEKNAAGCDHAERGQTFWVVTCNAEHRKHYGLWPTMQNMEKHSRLWPTMENMKKCSRFWPSMQNTEKCYGL